jgi:hypothetical protein
MYPYRTGSPLAGVVGLEQANERVLTSFRMIFVAITYVSFSFSFWLPVHTG